MSKCDSCGREGVDTQRIEIDGHGHYVCPRCYVQIKKNQMQIEQVAQTSVSDGVDPLLAKMAENINGIMDLIEQLQDRVADTRTHMNETIGGINRNFVKNKDRHDQMKKEIEELSEELRHLKSRIELLESKAPKKRKTSNL